MFLRLNYDTYLVYFQIVREATKATKVIVNNLATLENIVLGVAFLASVLGVAFLALRFGVGSWRFSVSRVFRKKRHRLARAVKLRH